MGWSFSPEAIAVRRYLYRRYLDNGRGANASLITEATGLDRRQVRDALLELERGVMVMIERDTDGVVIKCPPWSDIPTDHVIEVDGRFAGYAGCAFEALNAPFAYPGHEVTVTSACPHCGEQIHLTFSEDGLEAHEPQAAVLHVGLDPRLWAENWVAACANNNFFASAEHVAVWETAFPDHRGITLPLALANGLPQYRHRLDYERGADVGGGETILRALATLADVPASWKPSCLRTAAQRRSDARREAEF